MRTRGRLGRSVEGIRSFGACETAVNINGQNHYTILRRRHCLPERVFQLLRNVRVQPLRSMGLQSPIATIAMSRRRMFHLLVFVGVQGTNQDVLRTAFRKVPIKAERTGRAIQNLTKPAIERRPLPERATAGDTR